MNEETIQQTIAGHLKRKRQEGCLTLATIAEETGISQERLAALEHAMPMSAAELYRLCQFFQCNADAFWQGLPMANAQADDTSSELMQNFLNIDNPNRGQLFSDYLSDLKRDDG